MTDDHRDFDRLSPDEWLAALDAGVFVTSHQYSPEVLDGIACLAPKTRESVRQGCYSAEQVARLIGQDGAVDAVDESPADAVAAMASANRIAQDQGAELERLREELAQERQRSAAYERILAGEVTRGRFAPNAILDDLATPLALRCRTAAVVLEDLAAALRLGTEDELCAVCDHTRYVHDRLLGDHEFAPIKRGEPS